MNFTEKLEKIDELSKAYQRISTANRDLNSKEASRVGELILEKIEFLLKEI